MIRPVTLNDALAITNIYNDYITQSVASFETEPLSEEDMRKRIMEISSQYPYFVDERDGEIYGYCYAHAWKERAAYCNTLETTIYISPGHKRQGIGRALMEHLIEACRRQRYHALIACITGGNEGSIRLHLSLGFKQVSHFIEVGNKFGKKLDVVDFELLLTP